tara:strand:- start:34364 stop:35194 length:831 start_codon:yes stop_codon:yes gene_type:complete
MEMPKWPGNIQLANPLADVSDGNPLWILHGVFSSTGFSQIIRDKLQPPSPIYLLTQWGIEHEQVKSRSMEELVERYADAIIEHHPIDAPVPLLGYSAGGFISLELARQLNLRGREVKVTVVDPAAEPVNVLRGTPSIPLFDTLEDQRKHFYEVQRLPPLSQFSTFTKTERALKATIDLEVAKFSKTDAHRMLYYMLAQAQMIAEYTPKPLANTTTIKLLCTNSELEPDWRQEMQDARKLICELSDNVTYHELPGTHANVFVDREPLESMLSHILRQ